jgi:hypothetical protein
MKMFEKQAKGGNDVIHIRSKTVASRSPAVKKATLPPAAGSPTSAVLPAAKMMKRRSRTAGDLGAAAAAAVASVRAEGNQLSAADSSAGRVKRLSTMLGGLNIP